MTRKHTILISLACAAALAGCGNEGAQNIGEVGVLGAELSDYAGSWEGYAEAYEFVDGSDRVRVHLDEQGVGVIEVGDSAPLPEPDPTKGYPERGTFPGGDKDIYQPAYSGVLVPGFSYPIAAALVEENRIRFETASNELHREWCAGMEPVFDTGNSGQNGNGDVYSCLPNEATGLMYSGDQEVCDLGGETIDCGLLSCIWTCHCDAEACTVQEGGPDVRFDGALGDMGEELMGTLVMGERLTLRFTRD